MSRMLDDVRQRLRNNPGSAIERAALYLGGRHYSSPLPRAERGEMIDIILNAAEDMPAHAIHETSFLLRTKGDALTDGERCSLAQVFVLCARCYPKETAQNVVKVAQQRDHSTREYKVLMEALVIAADKKPDDVASEVSRAFIRGFPFYMHGYLVDIMEKCFEAAPKKAAPGVVAAYLMTGPGGGSGNKLGAMYREASSFYPDSVFDTVFEAVCNGSFHKDKRDEALDFIALHVSRHVKPVSDKIREKLLARHPANARVQERVLKILDKALDDPGADIIPVMGTVMAVLKSATAALEKKTRDSLYDLLVKGFKKGYVPALPFAATLLTEAKDVEPENREKLLGMIENAPPQLAGMAFYIANKLVLEGEQLDMGEKARMHNLAHSLASHPDNSIRNDAMQSIADTVAEKLGICDGSLLVKFARALAAGQVTLDDPVEPKQARTVGNELPKGKKRSGPKPS